MTATLYRSDDASAPVLTGQAGALNTLLQAILVDGYGAKAAAGWAREFQSGNVSVYRAATGRRMRLRVDDSGSGDGPDFARIIGYETMSDADTGTGPWPTSVQRSGGMYVFKSTSENATARPWIALADETYIYLFIQAGQTVLGNSSTSDSGFFFGDLVSFMPGIDDYASALLASPTNSTSGGAMGVLRAISDSNPFSPTTLYMPRNYTQAGSSVGGFRAVRWPVGQNSDMTIGGTSFETSYPDPISGGLLLSEIDVFEETGGGNYARRGRLPRFWAPLHNQPAANLDTFGGTGPLAGKDFLLVPVTAGSGQGRAALEIQ